MSRLISLFRSLSPREVKKFGQFFQSPYYNATPKMRALYRHLKKTHPNCPFMDEDKQQLFTEIFDSEAYNLRKMNNLMASLSSILQDFMLLQNMKKDTHARTKGLFDVYKTRKLDKLSLQQLSKLQKNFDTSPPVTAFEYYEGFKIYDELYFHPSIKLIHWKEGEDYEYLKKAQSQLRLFYAHVRMRYVCEMVFRETTPTEAFQLMPDEQREIQRLAADDAPLLKIYNLLYILLQKPDIDIYCRLRDYTFEYINKHSPRETNFLTTFLYNYQEGRVVAGDENAHEEILTLYKFGVEKNLYINETEHFRIGHFVNIAVYASETEDTEWLAAFIEQWKGWLKATDRENITNLSYAYLHFARHEYKETIALASRVRRNFQALALSCWTLEVRAYYMLQEQYDNWDNILLNFGNYLWRQKNIGENRKEANRNFISLLRLLYRATHEGKYTRAELLEKLDKHQNIVCKRWLKKQIMQLK